MVWIADSSVASIATAASAASARPRARHTLPVPVPEAARASDAVMVLAVASEGRRGQTRQTAACAAAISATYAAISGWPDIGVSASAAAVPAILAGVGASATRSTPSSTQGSQIDTSIIAWPAQPAWKPHQPNTNPAVHAAPWDSPSARAYRAVPSAAMAGSSTIPSVQATSIGSTYESMVNGAKTPYASAACIGKPFRTYGFQSGIVPLRITSPISLWAG